MPLRCAHGWQGQWLSGSRVPLDHGCHEWHSGSLFTCCFSLVSMSGEKQVRYDANSSPSRLFKILCRLSKIFLKLKPFVLLRFTKKCVLRLVLLFNLISKWLVSDTSPPWNLRSYIHCCAKFGQTVPVESQSGTCLRAFSASITEYHSRGSLAIEVYMALQTGKSKSMALASGEGSLLQDNMTEGWGSHCETEKGHEEAEFITNPLVITNRLLQ